MMTRIAAIGLFAFSLPACAQPPRQHAPPPIDFAVEQASPLDLQALGLPPDAADHPKLLRALQDPRLHTPPPVEGLPPMRNGPHMAIPGCATGCATVPEKRPDLSTATAFSSNWSGQVNAAPGLIPSASGTIEAEMTVPANTSHDGADDFVASWTGFDGWLDNNVLQAGVVCSSSFPCAAWYEYFPDFLTNTFRVNNGDDVQVFVWHTSADPHGHAIVYDATDGGYSNVAFDCVSCRGTDPFTGNSIEWIVERPEVNGTLSILTDYYKTVMFDATLSSPPRGPGGRGPTNINVVMQQNGVTVSDCTTPSKYTMVCEAYH